jgi:hypothetical protein
MVCLAKGWYRNVAGRWNEAEQRGREERKWRE